MIVNGNAAILTKYFCQSHTEIFANEFQLFPANTDSRCGTTGEQKCMQTEMGTTILS